jgi:hypothetical protein
MKSKHGLLFGFAVLLVAVMFTLTGCGDNGDPSSPPGGATDILDGTTWEETAGNVPPGGIRTTFNSPNFESRGITDGVVYSSGTYTVTGNSLSGTITGGQSGSGTFNGTITGNTIQYTSTVSSGSLSGTMTKKGSTGGGTTYTVSYTAGEGGGTAPLAQTVTSGTTINLPSQGNMTAPSGKTFSGWTAGGQAYAAGSSYTVTGNVTFTARWSPTNEPALTITHVAANTTVKITTTTISAATVFDSLAGVVANGQGTYPLLGWEAGVELTGVYNVMLRLVDSPNTVKYQNGVSFTNGFATVDWDTMDVGSSGGDDPDPDDETPTPDIDASLLGTWKDKPVMEGYGTPGDILTITFTGTTVIWGGTAGSALNTSLSSYQAYGSYAWTVKDGNIDLVYIHPTLGRQSYTCYTYVINGSGELELKVGGYTFATLTK